MEEETYFKKYESKVARATVILENEPNIDLLAKAVIMVAEDYLSRKASEGVKHGIDWSV